MDSSYDDMEIKLLKGRTIIVITDCAHLYADFNWLLLSSVCVLCDMIKK